jgi:putative intracellular protease/amidase
VSESGLAASPTESSPRELEAVVRSAEVVRRSPQLSDVRLKDYDSLVYLPGGHGPTEDLWVDADVGRTLTEELGSGRPLVIVCHAPAAMPATGSHGVSPFEGYPVTCFTNDEEETVGLASRTRWLLEDELRERGAEFSRGDTSKPYSVEGRNQITGRNPHSAAVLGERLPQVVK